MVATAGAGKTTAVAEAARRMGEPMAWLSVDRTDTTPGRLVTYLDAAFTRALPDREGIALSAMAGGIPWAEAAGILASSAADDSLVFVLDQLERLGDESDAWAVIESFIRHAGPAMRVVLVSRRDVPGGLCELPVSGTGSLGEAALAFTEEEAADALARQGVSDIDAARAVEVTGGWITGVLFEAWRSLDHVPGRGGEGDPLYGYLSAHILSGLRPDDRDFLIRTALLDEVTAERAAALGLSHGAARLAALRAERLPATWGAHTTSLRCHPRFREYLLELLSRENAADVQALRIRLGRLLDAEGRYEEAVEVMLQAGEREEALAPASRSIRSVIDRRDHAQAERWLRELEPIAAARDPLALSVGHLMLAVAREDFRGGTAYANGLAARGLRGQLARGSGQALMLMTLCYASSVDQSAMQEILDVAPPSPERTVARYIASIYTGEKVPAEELLESDISSHSLHPFVLIGKYFYGRISEMSAFSGSPWNEWAAVPSRMLCARALGHTQEALELYETIKSWRVRSLVVSEAAPELLLDAGQPDAARTALAEHGEVLKRSGNLVYRLSHLATVATMALRLDRDAEAALAALAAFDRAMPVQGVPLLEARADTWRGLALLLVGDDAAAATTLRDAARKMRAADAILDLPTAAVFLAEAEWRLGHEDEADMAADIALTAAHRQGSNFLLLQALEFFPAVASRRIDAEPAAGSQWHELGRKLYARTESGLPTTPPSSVLLREFGSMALLVDGEPAPTGIRKSLELLAYLSARGGKARREEVLHALFDGASDLSSQAYLRQARSRLNQALPESGKVASENGMLHLADPSTVTTESADLEHRLAEAGCARGQERLRATLAALTIAEPGDYLAGIRSSWADERRRRLSSMVDDARFEAAELALSLERYQEAHDLAERVLRDDPYREAAWRTTMRIASMLGDDDGVISAYRRCEQALAQLDAQPSSSTRELLRQLRR
ncbi:BTAD domain-containing putative transcriptional regulator [Streptomyces sp. NPDC002143]